jgi:uncharacterized protein YjlB
MIVELLNALAFGIGFSLLLFGLLFAYHTYFSGTFERIGIMGGLSFLMVNIGSSVLYFVIV